MLTFAALGEGGISKPFRLDVLVPVQREQRTDERTRNADLLITSALLAIWARPEGLLAELRLYPPDAGMEATLNGMLIVAPTHRCSKTRNGSSPTVIRVLSERSQMD